MSIGYNPKIVTSELIFCIDAANPKSYPGTGTTCYGLIPGSDGSINGNTVYNSAGYFSLDGVAGSTITTTATTYPSTWADPVTFELWMSVDADATWSNGLYNGGIFSRGSTTGTLGLARGVTNNSILMWLRHDGSSQYASGSLPSRDQWCHVVGMWNGINTISLYINGVPSTPITTVAYGVPDISNYYIGGMTGSFSGNVGNYMKGKVSVARIYSKALTQAEVLQNFNASRGRYGL